MPLSDTPKKPSIGQRTKTPTCAAAGLAVGILYCAECFFAFLSALTFLFLKIPQGLGLGVTWNLYVICRSIEVVSTENDVIASKVCSDCCIAFANRRVRANAQGAGKGCIQRRFDQSRIDNVDQATCGTAAIQQRCRTTYDFNAFSQQTFYGCLVVFTKCRRIQRVQTITQNANTFAKLAAYNWPGRYRAKIGRTKPGFLRQGLADAC